MGTLSEWKVVGATVNLIFPSLRIGSILKGKNLLPLSRLLFQKWLCVQECSQEVTEVVSFVKNWQKNSTMCSQTPSTRFTYCANTKHFGKVRLDISSEMSRRRYTWNVKPYFTMIYALWLMVKCPDYSVFDVFVCSTSWWVCFLYSHSCFWFKKESGWPLVYAMLASDQEVPHSSYAGSRTPHMTTAFHCTEPFSITLPSSLHDK